MAEPLLEVRDLKKHFPVKGSGLWGKQRFVKAVDGVTFTVKQGETLGLVGESGCGKTTTSKLILAAERATAGVIEFEGGILRHSQIDSCGITGARCSSSSRTPTAR